MSLLCAILFWNLKNKAETAPKIFYTYRTHSQISEAVKELKKLSITPKIALLGSRKHSCSNPNATDTGPVSINKLRDIMSILSARNSLPIMNAIIYSVLRKLKKPSSQPIKYKTSKIL